MASSLGQTNSLGSLSRGDVMDSASAKTERREAIGKKEDARATVAKKKENMPKLTAQQRRLIKALPHAKTVAEAGRMAGYSHRNAALVGLKNILEKVPDLFDRLGLTDEHVIGNCLLPGLYATKTEFATFEGKFTDSREIEDHGTRHKYLTMYLTLRGHINKYAREARGRATQDTGAAITIDLGRVSPELARTLLASAEANRGPDVLARANDQGRAESPEPE